MNKYSLLALLLGVLLLDYCDIEWFALETNRDHSVVFEIASKYCITDSLVPPWDFPGKSTGVGCHCLLRDTGCRYVLTYVPTLIT